MKHYKAYMDRQELVPAVHEKLVNLETRKTSSGRMWVQIGALAACAALILGVGAWKLTPAPAPVQSGSQFTPDHTSAAADHPLSADVSILGDWEYGFLVSSPMDENQTVNFFYMPGIEFPDITAAPEVALSRAYVPGSFLVDLVKEDVQKLFWGPEGIPETYQTEIGRQDLPWSLFWDGYFVHGSAWYDGEGQLMELTLWGEQGRAGFTLELCPGELPFSCVVDLDRGDKISEFNGIKVAGWSKVYDRDGDGETDYICGSEFMTKNEIGVRFTSWNNGTVEDGVDGEAWFNTLFIREALTGGLSLDHLNTAEHIPAWREEEFSTLAQARQEEEFAPYLPQTAPVWDAWEFYGRLSYQEGSQNMLFVRWSKGYDDVEVAVYHRDGYRSYDLADPDNPASYDLRLYDIPWSDSVPEEYRDTVNLPAFRAEDMSLSIVEARGKEKDTGGLSFNFDILHPDGTLVTYRCDGMTAQQVWELVNETL